jgi:AbrB family looped-hinge helix DNA binding protein
MEAYISKVTSKGQIVIPKHIRAKYGIKTSTIIRWIPRDDGLLMVPDSPDPIYKARGLFKKAGLLKKLMNDKNLDKKKENQRLDKAK